MPTLTNSLTHCSHLKSAVILRFWLKLLSASFEKTLFFLIRTQFKIAAIVLSNSFQIPYESQHQFCPCITRPISVKIWACSDLNWVSFGTILRALQSYHLLVQNQLSTRIGYWRTFSAAMLRYSKSAHMKSIALGAFLFTLALLFPSSARSQQAGKFDYYLLALSWSPEFCHSHQDSPECSKHLGLIVHGLWPQYNGSNTGPEHCSQQPGPSNPDSLLDILPTTSLIDHEWVTHGVCSGMSADDYFGFIRKLYSNFHVPPQLQHPNRQSVVRVADLKHAIAQANPGMNESEIALACSSRYLSAVELCLTKDGKPQPCSSLRECRGSSIFIPAVQ